MRVLFPRLLAVILIVSAAVSPVSAIGFDAGFKAGYSAATISGDPSDLEFYFGIPIEGGYNYRNGFTGGVFFDFHVTERISIQVEATYMQRGAWVKNVPFDFWTGEEFIEGDLDAEFRQWYFDFPVLAKMTFRRGSFFSPFVYAGPAYSYSQRSVWEATFSFGPYAFGVRDNMWALIKHRDLGLVMGGGMNFSFWGFHTFLEGRYYLGMINLNRTDRDINTKNRAIGAYLGVSIPFSE